MHTFSGTRVARACAYAFIIVVAASSGLAEEVLAAGPARRITELDTRPDRERPARGPGGANQRHRLLRRCRPREKRRLRQRPDCSPCSLAHTARNRRDAGRARTDARSSSGLHGRVSRASGPPTARRRGPQPWCRSGIPPADSPRRRTPLFSGAGVGGLEERRDRARTRRAGGAGVFTAFSGWSSRSSGAASSSSAGTRTRGRDRPLAVGRRAPTARRESRTRVPSRLVPAVRLWPRHGSGNAWSSSRTKSAAHIGCGARTARRPEPSRCATSRPIRQRLSRSLFSGLGPSPVRFARSHGTLLRQRR